MHFRQWKRREFITLLGGAAAWPLAARAQQPAMPVIGFLNAGTAAGYATHVTAFRQGMAGIGYVEGRDIAIEYRWAEGQYDRAQALVADLVRRQVAIICVTASTALVQAAKAATSSVPIVFVIGADPVKFGLVASLNRPGGNITGVSFLVNLLAAKQLEMLHDAVPKAAAVGFLVNPGNPNAAADTAEVRNAAGTLGLALRVASATAEDAIENALGDFGAGAGPCTPDRVRSSVRRAPGTTCDLGPALRVARYVQHARLCPRRRPDELWPRSERCLSTSRSLCRTHSQG